jgi:hypothetical protein
MSFDPKKLIREQRQEQVSSSWLLTKIHDFNQAHNRLKHNVHTAWRYPLPPWGRAIMACVYFSIPVAGGYALSTYAVSKSEATVQARFGDGGKLSNSRFLFLNRSKTDLKIHSLPLDWHRSYWKYSRPGG